MGKKVYFCEGYNPKDKSRSCPFVLGQTMSGAKLTKTEVKKLLEGKHTKALTFTAKSKKKYKAKLFWDKSKQTLGRDFVNDTSLSAQKTKVTTADGSTIKEDKFYWINGDKKGKINKNIWGHEVSTKEAKALFEGQTLGPFTFTWKSGKSSEAKIVFNTKSNKVDFIFK